MKKRVLILLLYVIMSILSVVLIGCSNSNTPPSVLIVQECYEKHSEDIQLITDYLSSLSYEDIYITDNSGTMLADLKRLPIDNKAVVDAIVRLITSTAYQHINKDGNTISFLQWRGIRDIGCGIAYTINGIELPEIEFLTQLTSLSDVGWFYYVSDYNAWRELHNCHNNYRKLDC